MSAHGLTAPTVRPFVAARWRTLAGPAVLGLVLVASAALRLRDLGARSLWIDELFGIALGAQDLSTTLAVLYGDEANMALYYLLMASWVRLVGGSADELWMRLPSVVFGVASLWALYRVGAELDCPALGLVAAALAAANAFHVEMAQEARAYTLWIFWVCLAWWALVRALRTGRRPAWLAYAGFTALAVYSHFFTAFFVVPQVVLVLARRSLVELRSQAVSGVIVAGLCLPLLPFFLFSYDDSYITHVRRSDLGDLIEVVRSLAGSTTPLLAAYVVFGTLGTTIAVRRARRTRRPGDVALALAPLLWAAVPIALVFTLSYVKPMFKDRYLFAATPALALWAATGIVALRPRAVATLTAILFVGASLAPALGDAKFRQDENWRAAIGYVTAGARADDGAIFISKRGQLGYEYYGGWLSRTPPEMPRPEMLEPFDWRELATAETNYRALASGTARLPDFAARHPRIWLVLSHEFDSTFDGDTSQAVRDWLTRRGYAARQRSFQNVRVLLYERRV